MRRNKFISWGLVGGIGFFIGAFAYLNGARYFLMQDQEMSYSVFDLFSFVGVNKKFDTYDYLSSDYPFLYFNLFVFVMIGLMMSCSSFLLRPKSYLSFFYTRYPSFKQANQYLRGSTVGCTFVYTLAYFIGIFCLSQGRFIYSFSDLIAVQWIGILVNLVLKVCLIEALKQFIFVIYLKKEAAIAFVVGALSIFSLIIIDLIFPFSCFILFDESKEAIYMIVPFVLIKFGLNWITNNRIKINDVTI